MFDMSPLKKVFVRGPDAAAVLDHLTTRDMGRIAPGQAAYLSVLTEQGTMADDAIVSNNGGNEWMIVHGSGDTMALLEASAAGKDVGIEFTDDLHDISVQGPQALNILNPHCSIDLPKAPMRMRMQDRPALPGDRRQSRCDRWAPQHPSLEKVHPIHRDAAVA